MWQVIRINEYSFQRPIYDRFGSPIGTEIVTEPAGTVVGRHNQKKTAEKHRDKNNRTNKMNTYIIRAYFSSVGYFSSMDVP